MNWSEPKDPIGHISSYDHVICDTPLGRCIIGWKYREEFPSYNVEINGEWISSEYSLEEAKTAAVIYLFKKHNELYSFLVENISVLPTPTSPEI